MNDDGWAKGWLQGVAEARDALKRAAEILEAQRERAVCVSNPMTGCGARCGGDSNKTESNIIGLLTAEEEYAAIYEWAREALDEFDRMVLTNKPGFRGSLLSGMDIVELKYRHGMTEAQVMEALHISRSKLYADQAALIDYLDSIGYARAMSLDTSSVA